jgi:hypothetical protein
MLVHDCMLVHVGQPQTLFCFTSVAYLQVLVKVNYVGNGSPTPLLIWSTVS